MALTVDNIRTYIRDSTDLNILLEGEQQSSDALISLAMSMAISDFNAITPKTNYSADSFPYDSLLLYGSMHHLANMEAERQLRNQISYNAQGVNAGIDDKMPQYNSLAQYYKQLFDAKAQPLKQQDNMAAAWGGSSSPYAAINQFIYRN